MLCDRRLVVTGWLVDGTESPRKRSDGFMAVAALVASGLLITVAASAPTVAAD